MNKRLLGVLLMAALLGACKPASPPPPPVAAANDPHAMLQAEMEKASMDFSRVVVVRLTGDGKRLEVTSVMPAVIAETQLSGQAAKTIFRVNDAGDGLAMFSRDLPKGTSYRAEIRFAELESKKSLVFPVVQKDGSLKEQKFTLEKIIIPGN